MKKLVQIGRVLCSLMAVLLVTGLATNDSLLADSGYKIISSKNMKEIAGKNANAKDAKMDLNKVSKEEMYANKVSLKVAGNIVEYRELTGGFDDITELKLISGVGAATYEKIKDKFVIKRKNNKKQFDINKASDKQMKYYGLTTKDIKTIQAYIAKNGKIRNNMDLMNVLDSAKYEKYKELVRY